MSRYRAHSLVLVIALAAAIYTSVLQAEKTLPPSEVRGNASSTSNTSWEYAPNSTMVLFLESLLEHAMLEPAISFKGLLDRGIIGPGRGGEAVVYSAHSPEETREHGDGCEPVRDDGVYCIYTAQPGDTLSGIAHSFGIVGNNKITGAEMLAQSNLPYIAETNEVFEGQSLRVPVISGLIHTVVAVETLDEVALNYGVSSASIVELEANGISDPSLLAMGQELLIPSPTRIPLPVAGSVANERSADSVETAAPARKEDTNKESEPEAAPARIEDQTAAPPASANRSEPSRSKPESGSSAAGSRNPVVYQPDELRPLLAAHPWPVNEALVVIYGAAPGCPTGESSGNTRAAGPSGGRGLFQVSPVHVWRFERHGWTWDDAFVAERNIAIAYEIYKEAGGWWPWGCRPT